MTGDNASKMQLDAAVLGVGRERGARGSSVYWNVKIEALPLCFTKGWLAFGVDLGVVLLRDLARRSFGGLACNMALWWPAVDGVVYERERGILPLRREKL